MLVLLLLIDQPDKFYEPCSGFRFQIPQEKQDGVMNTGGPAAVDFDT